jgi:RNA polymerase sigma-70 factor (ECF subfamily)
VIDRARRGERDALAELWRTHQPDVLRYLRTRRTTAPEDVASQVWLDVAESIHRFEGDEGDFRGWLFTIVHRRSVDAIRRSVRDDRIVTRSADAVETATVQEGADDEFGRADSLDQAVALIASLPEQMGAAVMLRVVNEMPVADVAEILRTSEGNVRVLVHRGMERLRRKLDVTKRRAPTMRQVP